MTTILVVDDVVENRYLLVTLFQGNGYEVFAAANGVEALERAQNSTPDVVVTDVMMPVMDGFELCRRWKRDERLKRIPFVIYTATYTEPQDERLALSLGADRFVIKPQKPEQLLKIVRDVLAAAEGLSVATSFTVSTDDLGLTLRHNEALGRKLDEKVRALQAEIARRTAIESELRESERKFRLLAENSLDVVWSLGFDGHFTYISPAVEKLQGYTQTEAMQLPMCDLVGPAAIELIERELAQSRAELAAGRSPTGSGLFEFEQPCKNGSTVSTEVSASIMRDEAGTAIGVQGVTRDVTERKHAQQLQSQLLQAQKLESIGRLAGGIAHDFNNLLSIILINANFAIGALREGDPLRADVEEIRKAGERAAALTRQLLAFSRKQRLKTELLSLNRVISDFEDMLRRLLGEDVVIDVRLEEALGSVKADPGQIEQVIINLAVNARDAMPRGGKLVIETGNVDLDESYTAQNAGVQAGPFVMLAVSDSGSGMSAEVRGHIFEPFFTTKEIGKGTGLGLSTVYGIVQQSGGSISVESEPGRGATFKIYLPRIDAPAPEAGPKSVRALAGGTETILVVEDDDSVRRIVERILRGAGYHVLGAQGGGDALILCEKHCGGIDLLLTDVVMPQMSGPELAERASRLCPMLQVLYMSGHTDRVVAIDGAFAVGAHIISKPLEELELTRMVRDVLDEREAN